MDQLEDFEEPEATTKPPTNQPKHNPSQQINSDGVTPDKVSQVAQAKEATIPKKSLPVKSSLLPQENISKKPELLVEQAGDDFDQIRTKSVIKKKKNR